MGTRRRRVRVANDEPAAPRAMQNASQPFADIADYANYTYAYDDAAEFTTPLNRAFTQNDTWQLLSNDTKKSSCVWEAAQHNSFQFSNICFLTAFIIPRTFKFTRLLFRIILCISFLVSAVWAGVHFCSLDWLVWSSGLAITNGIHAIVLTFRFLPPALSLELTELYIRVFKPFKVSKKHFKELSQEACLLRIAGGETYAAEEVTPADERLSILLKGKMKVCCCDTFLHNISSYQFIDSPEYQANPSASGCRFQVTIIAEEDCVCLYWPRLKLDRILRHRPQLGFVMSSLVGKDITHKMYALNEHIGHLCTTEALSRAARNDHWRRNMNRSVSVDAVNTGTKGQVHSVVWMQAAEKNRKNSATQSETVDSPLNQQQACWVPVVASQFPAECPFNVEMEEEVNGPDEEREPMLRKTSAIPVLQPVAPRAGSVAQLQLTQMDGSMFGVGSGQPVALLPVMLPLLAPADKRRQRGVKFDETRL